MEDVFLCENCKPFGYCKQKVGAGQKQTFGRLEPAVNNKIKGLEPVVIADLHLTSLESIRALYINKSAPQSEDQQARDLFLSGVIAIAKTAKDNLIEEPVTLSC